MSPLAQCAALQNLSLTDAEVDRLAPLAGCAALRRLYIGWTEDEVDVAPLGLGLGPYFGGASPMMVGGMEGGRPSGFFDRGRVAHAGLLWQSGR